MPVTAVAFFQIVLALHIVGAIGGFGGLFVFPLLLAGARRLDPTLMPWLLRMRQLVGRVLINPGLTLVLIAGIYMATDEHYWKWFFVQWGIGAVVVIGGIEGSIVIRRAGRLAAVAERDLAATAVPGGGRRLSAKWSGEYVRGARVIAACDLLMMAIVVVTVFLMAIHA